MPLEAWAIILNAFVLLVIGFQAYTYHKQRELMEQTLRYSQRAFVYAKDAFFIGGRGKPGIPQPDRPALVCITFENTGSTPARNVRLNVKSFALRGELPSDFSYPLPASDAAQARYLVAPKATPQMTVPIKDDVLGEIYAGKRNLVVYGAVFYDDIFGKSRKTMFSFRYSSYVLNDDGTLSKTIFAPGERHNCDDENCPEKWGDNDAGLTRA